MLDRIITWSLEHRVVVLVLALLLVGTGVQALVRLPIDAFPDTTPVQVQVNTVAPALSPFEIEQQVTFAVEQAIGGLPRLAEVRSTSRFGLSQVTAIFEDGTDIYFARQLVMERLQTVDLPEGIARPALGPVSTGLGEIYHYLVRGEGFALERLTEIHDWVIRPRLRSVPGVAEVNTWGGKRKEFHVLVDLSRLMKFDLTLEDVLGALRSDGVNVGGGSVTEAGELHLVRGVGWMTSIEDVEGIVIAAHDGVPVRIRDLAEVRIGHEIRRGAVTAYGKGEVVMGLGFLLMGENSREVTRRLDARMAEIRAALPPGVEVIPVYERSHLVGQVIETVRLNLFEGAILVVAVLFVFLGNLRAGLIVASAIPLSMLFAFNGMLRIGIAGSLMSLGAIDFGLLVDSSVIMVENSVRRLASARGSRPHLDVIREASVEVRKPTMFGELIIMIVYLPILTLEGTEGKLFRPMALTVIFALAGSLLLSLTLMPVLASFFLRGGAVRPDNLVVRGFRALYRPVLRFALRARHAVIAGAVVFFAGGVWLFARTGSEFLPRLSEMGIVVNLVRLAGISVEESVRYGTRLEQWMLEKFPDEIEHAWTRTGTAEVATDPMGIELADLFLTLKPRREWKRARTQEELVVRMREELSGLPGMRTVFTQPIEMRLNEMVAGIRAALGVKIFGDDLETLQAKAKEVEAILQSVGGAEDVYTEQITGQPVLEAAVDREAIARHGVPALRVLDVVEAIGGIEVGEVHEGDRRFPLVVRLAEKDRSDPTAVGEILVPTAGGERLPLARLTRIRHGEGPSTVTREWQKRRIVVVCNVADRDIGGFVREVRREIESKLELPAGYWVDYGGQFEHLQRARARLLIVVPLALCLILFLLYLSTGSVRDTLLIFTGAPFAAIGGVAALAIRGMPFTISAGVGFVAVSGVAMLNGLVLVSTIKHLVRQGRPLGEAIEESALTRLRPVLMTALVASLGFVPMALSTGVGAEVQRPLATVVVGGVVSDNLLTLVALPALYAVFGRRGFRLTAN